MLRFTQLNIRLKVMAVTKNGLQVIVIMRGFEDSLSGQTGLALADR